MILGQEKLILKYHLDIFLNKTRLFFGTEEVDLGQKKTNYGTKQGDILGQEKSILGHNKTKFGTNLGDFLK